MYMIQHPALEKDIPLLALRPEALVRHRLALLPNSAFLPPEHRRLARGSVRRQSSCYGDRNKAGFKKTAACLTRDTTACSR